MMWRSPTRPPFGEGNIAENINRVRSKKKGKISTERTESQKMVWKKEKRKEGRKKKDQRRATASWTWGCGGGRGSTRSRTGWSTQPMRRMTMRMSPSFSARNRKRDTTLATSRCICVSARLRPTHELHTAPRNGHVAAFAIVFFFVNYYSRTRLHHPPPNWTKVADISGWMIKPVGPKSSSKCRLYCAKPLNPMMSSCSAALRWLVSRCKGLSWSRIPTFSFHVKLVRFVGAILDEWNTITDVCVPVWPWLPGKVSLKQPRQQWGQFVRL